MRELHFYSLLRTKELEVQWNLARYEQQRKHAEQESHRAKALHAQVSTFSQTEAELRSQLNIYVEKFKQVSPHTPKKRKRKNKTPKNTLSPISTPSR